MAIPAGSGGDGSSTPNNDSITITYLHRMIYYASALANSNDSGVNDAIFGNDKNNNNNKLQNPSSSIIDGESLVNLLARELLLAADPTNLRSSLPIPASFLLPGEERRSQDAQMENCSDDDDDDEVNCDDDTEINFLPYKIDMNQIKGGRPRNPTRIDALRSLLRVLAPVAMDVAARVACHVLLINRQLEKKEEEEHGIIVGGESNVANNENEACNSSNNSTAEAAKQERLRAFVLFGYWIPFAPQLAPIISDLFGEFHRFQGKDNDDSCPISLLPFVAKIKQKVQQGMSTSTEPQSHPEYTIDEAETAVVVSEAARDLLNVYCNKRYEHKFVRKWWNWDSCLFLLIHAGDSRSRQPSNNECSKTIDADGDVVMDENNTTDENIDNADKRITFFIGGYSPETNVPHCALQWKNPTFQIKWFASRAVGALFALRPLPLSKFLKALDVYENAVPFVRHPWKIDMEDATFENNLLRGVGRVVLPKVEDVNIKYGHGENDAFAYYEPLDSTTKASIESPNVDEDMGDDYTFELPSMDDIRNAIPLHPSLVHVGRGIIIPRRGSVASYDRWCQLSMTHEAPQEGGLNSSCCFVPTHTTMKNMALLGIAMSSDPHPPPILVCGPPGSGKSSLVREMSRLCSSFSSELGQRNTSSHHSCQEDELLELHVDEETDSKTLLGSFVATDIPGEFVWMAGPLTAAARLGRWVLIEDVDKCPEEIQAALIRLFKERILPLGVGKEEKCHPRFRLFGTLVTGNTSIAAVTKTRRKSSSILGTGITRVLHPNLWRKVHVDPLPFVELREVGRKLHPNLPHSVADAVLDVVRKLDKSGRDDGDDVVEAVDPRNQVNSSRFDKDILGHGARHASVRDFIKLLSRISTSIHFEPGCDYATEAQRLTCLADTVDVFAMSCPHVDFRRNFICRIGAPTWGLTPDAATRYIENRIPTISFGASDNRLVEIGRARLLALKREEDETDVSTPGRKRNFAETNHALRLIESIAVCASQNEPALLVGETGCGKTTLVQRLANLTGRALIVQNLSLQTDSTDLLGGYKPLEMRHVARGVYDKFVDLFVSSFSRSQNAQFLSYVLAAFEKHDWKKLAQCFLKAASMGETKMREGSRGGNGNTINSWVDFRLLAEHFERQRLASESGLAFLFTEGALVDAIRTGKWVLLDEINLASSETLQRLCGLLDDSHGSITLTEKGDAEAIRRHPDFRLFAAMNPATDTGKKDLPPSIRSRFTEIYVDELVDPVQLRSVAARYLDGAVTTNGIPLEHSESVTSSVEVYLKCRLLSDQSLVDGGGQKPRYTMRTLCRTLSAARNLIIQQRFAPQRAILEGFQLAFEGSLDLPSRDIINAQFTSFLPNGFSYKERDHPGKRPDGRSGSNSYVLINPFWIKSGKEEQHDWADPASSPNGKAKFVLTPSATSNLRRLCQAVASGPWSILLEGPTSAGKTSLIEYLAARCGHKCVRINNHEHTDIQEYTGSYAADSKGNISFQEGILVQALRRGHWVILDELNLAPSDVLEALNRLLDDNRELYLPEINEAVKPHANFRLFATQNPAGAYGGRKPLSRAFRNRFVEIHMSDIPEDEMIIILERRCGCPPSHAKLLVNVMKCLRQRRSRTGIFRGKDGLITPRDLLRWAGRGSASKKELAEEGYMLLAERLRIDEEKDVVRSVIEKELKVTINMADVYYGEQSDGRQLLENALPKATLTASGLTVHSIAPTQSMMRLLTLVMRCVKQKEPVLLVGETGCGKTTVVQLLSIILQRRLTVINCHASTETGDILGGFRPVRARQNIAQSIIEKATELVQNWKDPSFRIDAFAPAIIHQSSPSQLRDFSHQSPKEVVEFLRNLVSMCRPSNVLSTEASKSLIEDVSVKRRKLSKGKDSILTFTQPDQEHCQKVVSVYNEVEHLYQKYVALFEWADGPLVRSMKDGSLLLLDEMNLAEDAVLERLNSVLEPSRTLTLAERGGDGPSCMHKSDSETSTNSEIRAHDEFRIFATMNPGGDFGKRELSPALRSRFTEIWVPPVSQLCDIDLVLERSFLSSLEQRSIQDASLVSGLSGVRRMMLDYFNWFNVDVCEDPNSFCNEFKLSLRDVLSWARFIADVYLKRENVDLHHAYVHGASLMHLDGLGLGTGISNQDAATTKKKAKNFLLRQISHLGIANVSGFNDELEGSIQSIVSTSDNFGIIPFTIPVGSEEIPANLGFNLSAPTTGLNLRRVLRGMQISKPILLEGSPGVGKTSLILALAKASGHQLVRINLSEQTDVSDLMGTDVPYSGENENDSMPSTSSFRWSDGVLLKAIKRGDWVLLDELNLASQSVLEGLNSCLDHRASVYIPELGRSFECPPTFRIFAAQNPLAQGGGRKGLPKSFLNRFTKVYIEALTKQDIFSIATAQFSSVPKEIMEKMIDFNDGVQRDIDSRLYGQHGCPWEFNLRDIFRWCQLLQSSGCRTSLASAQNYADILYTQRLRTDHDRSLISERFNSFFGSRRIKSHPKITVTEKHVRIGSTVLDRFSSSSHWSAIPTLDSEPDMSESLLRPLEAIACCVHMNWPCLLVGPSSSGKSALLRTLADACNVHIETLAMSSSTDVTELIGCFEQTDSMGEFRKLLVATKRLYEESCLIGKVHSGLLHTTIILFQKMSAEMLKKEQHKVYDDSELIRVIEELVGLFEKILQLYPEVSGPLSCCVVMSRKYLTSLNQSSAAAKVQSPFRWVDGILVQAMERGYWLHLENVNFCPSSVLDRLNPLMEFEGKLVVTECGLSVDDQNSKPKVIKPHPNFRLFLSMNPTSHGEVSRAMRNRCVEVCVLPPEAGISPSLTASDKQGIYTIDALTALWDAEVRSHTVGSFMVARHIKDCPNSTELQEETRSMKYLKEWGGLFIGLLKRGLSQASVSVSYKIVYELHDEESGFDMEWTPSTLGLVTSTSIREDLGYHPNAAQIVPVSRLLKAMSYGSNDTTTEILEHFMQMTSQSYRLCKLVRHRYNEALFKCQSITRLMELLLLHESEMASYLDGYCTKTATEIKLVARLLADAEPVCLSPCENSVSRERGSRSQRVSQLLEESMTYLQLNKVGTIPPPCDMSVIAVSYLMHTKRIDASVVSCPVTPLLFPFFQAMDLFLIRQCNRGPSHTVSFGSLLLYRDRLWRSLKRNRFIGTRTNSKIGFLYSGFLVNYCWLLKSFAKFRKCLEGVALNLDDDSHHCLHRLVIFFESIDETIQESTGGSISSSDRFWKKGGHPILPSKRESFDELNNLNKVSLSCSLVVDELFGFTRIVSGQLPHPIDLKQLITLNHPSLFIQKKFSTELLWALAMTFWATTDESKGLLARGHSPSVATQVLSKSFSESKTNFVANIRLATIDTSIRTIENALDLDSIKSIIGEHSIESNNSDVFLNNLLIRFGEIQATQLGEIVCTSEEAALIGELTKVLRRSKWPISASIALGLQSLRHRIKLFIEKILSHTHWSIVDLRPYQTLIWALESETTTDDALHHIMRSILHRMLFSYYNHMWSNTYNDLESISDHLVGPSIWNKDDSNTSKSMKTSLLGQSAKIVLLSSCAGPTRSKMNVDRSAMFRLLRLPSTHAASAYMTMENSVARQVQAMKLLPLLASQEQMETHANQAEMIKYLFLCVFDVFHEMFGQDRVDLNVILESHFIETSDIEAVFKKCDNKSVRSITSLAISLIENVHGMNKSSIGSCTWKRNAARAWIYLGLIRLHLSVPSTPIDPGQKPAAKVDELDWFLQDIRMNLLSYNLHYGLYCGDFAPDIESTRRLFCLSDDASKKRLNQEKKIVERPLNAPPFNDLFREIHHFCRTVASPGIVLGLIASIENDNCRESRSRSYEINWQCSASSFCTRLTTVYSMYEDITIPCINEIRAIQRGLRELALAFQDECPQARLLAIAQDELLKYPLGNMQVACRLSEECYSSVLTDLLGQSGAGVERIKQQDIMIIQRSIQLATLLRLQIFQLMNRQTVIGGGILHEVNCIFSSLANLPETVEYDGAASSSTRTNEFEKEEKEFREFFPDHGAEFKRIVESSVDDMGDEEKDVDVQEGCVDATLVSKLSDAEMSLAVTVHAELFSGRNDTVDDNIRLRAFRISYEAASHLGHFTEWITKSEGDSSCRGSHILALALKCSINKITASEDFHNDPSPTEAIRADLPLRNLLIRVGQLLRAFPGHAVLVALGQVIERVRQLDIQAVALGKVMSGLEVILRKSQDWEQHASQHVALGKPLKDIGALVASWRKIELRSWSSLLTLREKRRTMLAKRHWLRLYNLIHKQRDSSENFYSGSSHQRRRVFSPHWVWKGHPELSIYSIIDDETKGLDELAKILDTFLLTSNIAEFRARLGLLESFAHELENELKVHGMKRHGWAMLLQSLCNHYSRFVPLVMQTKHTLREPIEKSLKDEVKLAKWDEQSYYSLAESSEKNHRKLMKHLRDYDKALDTAVLSILETNYAAGIRSSNQTCTENQEPTTTIPADSTFFPELFQSETTDGVLSAPFRKVYSLTYSWKGSKKDISSGECTAASLGDSVDKYVLKIGHYALKMKSMIAHRNSYAHDAAILATEISDAIFKRIHTLRQPKMTKQVKQRALVDLFKCLNEQGYSGMKWSVPSNVRAPLDMLQLPIPSFGGTSPWDSSVHPNLERGESYFHRCQVEVSRLRLEIAMLGSQYMSLREMTLMQGYSDYMLFMICQQRCMIAVMIQAVADIDSLVQSYGSLTDSLPLRQTELSKKIIGFEKSISTLTEGIYQLILLIKSSLSLVPNESVRGRVHDTIAILSSCASILEENYSPCNGILPITSAQIQHIRKHMASILEEIKSKMASCMEICDGKFPSLIFETCLLNATQALTLALSLNEAENESTFTALSHADGLKFDVISSLVQSTLIAAQSICPSKSSTNLSSTTSCEDVEDESSQTLCRCHREMLEEFKNLRLEKIHNEMSHTSRALISLHDDTSTNEILRTLFARATGNSFSLVGIVTQMMKAQLGDAVIYFMEHSKLLYVLLRVFRVLVSKGFCSDDVSEGGDGSGKGDANEMKFEDDVEGTGMGEGEGKNDVTDEIENEEQLLGLKGDDKKETLSQERKELKEDEVDTGMEMEGDFEGEKYDLPDKPEEQKDEASSENEEELDREMGDGEDPNEQVVDEKMWDNDEDDLQEMQQEEKFEENSKLAGEQIEDEMRTGDDKDDEGQKNDHALGQDSEHKDSNQDEGKDTETNDAEGMINDDIEDKYEDKNAGVDVRNDDNSDSGAGEEEKENEDGVDMNDLNLNDGEEGSTCSAEDFSGNVEPDACDNPVEDQVDPDEKNDDVECEDDMSAPDATENIGEGGIVADDDEDPIESEENNGNETHITPPPKNKYESNDALGIAAENGQDTVAEANDEKSNPENPEDNSGGDATESRGLDETSTNESRGAGSNGIDDNWKSRKDDDQSIERKSDLDDVPNPFRSPGDAEKFWHKKLHMLQDRQNDEQLLSDEASREQHEEAIEKDGQFEYTQEGEDSRGQVLGIAEEDQAKQLEDHSDDDFESCDPEMERKFTDIDEKREKQDQPRSSSGGNNETEHSKNLHKSDAIDEEQNEADSKSKVMDPVRNSGEEENIPKTSMAMTDSTHIRENTHDDDNDYDSEGEICEIDMSEQHTAADIQQAREYWQTIQSDTNNLSRRLCEKLRLVMEPLVATKLRGDYRTGKRVNMKRIIGYIASGYRKDKIWLRRTKPAKRDYRVLIAVDNSESMQKSRAGDMALRALATLANGMSQLEIGQLGIASFGEDMKLLHPFNIPFTSESGVNIVSNFQFDAKRTRTALCVESAVSALEGAHSVLSSMQLVFMISDGRIERDSRSKLRRLIRQMSEKNMLMVMIIVEGEENNIDGSILNMKEVSFVNGKPKIKHFIEDYPFPYYLVVGDLTALPEILGDCLRQWFEMLSQIQNA